MSVEHSGSTEPKRTNRTYSSRHKKLKNIPPKPLIDVKRHDASYTCPNCKKLSECQLITLPVKLLKDPKKPLVTSVICTCNVRCEIRYTVNRNRKIKLVDFLCKGESVLTKARRSFKVDQ